MKKFLVILMVVAMASVLFVGCTTPPTPEPEPEPTPTPSVKTDTPFITAIDNVSLSSTSTQYSNSAPDVSGVGVAGAIIKVYIDDVQSGVGSTGDSGAFTDVPVSMVTLTEGVRVIYATATQPGLAESDASTKYTFTYDYTKPTIASAAGDSSAQTITVTFSEDVNMNLEDTTSTTFTWAKSALRPANWSLNGTTLGSTYSFSVVSSKVVRITCLAATLVTGTNKYVGVDDVNDLANNAITTESVVNFIPVP